MIFFTIVGMIFSFIIVCLLLAIVVLILRQAIYAWCQIVRSRVIARRLGNEVHNESLILWIKIIYELALNGDGIKVNYSVLVPFSPFKKIRHVPYNDRWS